MQKVTLCLLVKENKVLLAMKKRGFGVGKWNGIGGKIQEGETIKEAAVRESQEEVGVILKSTSLEWQGEIVFSFDGKPELDQEMIIFLVREWQGQPEESEEMKPQWFQISELPVEEMWVADSKWMPLVLAGKKIRAKIVFDATGDSIMSCQIEEI